MAPILYVRRFISCVEPGATLHPAPGGCCVPYGWKLPVVRNFRGRIPPKAGEAIRTPDINVGNVALYH